MGLHTELTDSILEVDVIIAGGGTAGCVIASRLADADKQLSILVVESGQDNFGLPTVTNPALCRATLMPGTANAFHYKSRKEAQLSDREVVVTTGGLLGGSSSINGMIYQRGQLCNFDSWDTRGWSGKEVVSFLKKFETYDGEDGNESHGHDGPMHVSGGLYRGKEVGDDFIAATAQLGYPEVQDLQDLETVNAVSPLRRFDGEHPNLHVLVGSQVTRIIFDEGKRATGVEFRPNPELKAEGSAERPATGTVRARNMVIVTAGAFGSPNMLERSGIGALEVLQQARVPVVAHLPGVGHGYQDHQASLYTYKAEMPPEDSWESIYNGTRQIPELLANNDKILSWNGVDASAKIRPTQVEADSLGPRFRQTWDQDVKDVRSKPLVSLILITGILGDPTPFPPGLYLTVCSYTTYPYSRGHVHITGPSIDDAVDFKTEYLSDPDDFDLKAQVWAYKKQRRVARGMPVFGGELPGQHPAFPEGSKASPVPEKKAGGDGAATDVEYGPEDDAAIKHFIRTSVGTTWHPLGTCKMAPVEQMGVVDDRRESRGYFYTRARS
ncbi:hypothetical protein INS49_014682 [Diaporthe citri]|uniref:uncharacterized protein n=1 Tax=Diaporthe citri TaxID=83186 RepID=UPI001C7F20BD|nr:uncharacterized protein INS49_014682 [Diaporthe citri]KAG6356808.1 hypothetical protein INS49_014682 [Diaporthe citri]